MFTVIIAIVNIAYVLSPFGKPKLPEKTLVVSVPEDLEYEGMFDDVLDSYTTEHELEKVETTNMGSLFKVQYSLRMREEGTEKAMIDELRCLNGNLKIALGRSVAKKEAL